MTANESLTYHAKPDTHSVNLLSEQTHLFLFLSRMGPMIQMPKNRNTTANVNPFYS